VIVWLGAFLAVYFIAKREGAGRLDERDRKIFLFIGFLAIILSLVSIRIGFGRPPYSIDDYSILLSGASIMLFAWLRYGKLIVPAAMPLVGVVLYQGYYALPGIMDFLAAPLIPLVTYLTVLSLNLLGIGAVAKAENLVQFTSLTNDPIRLRIVTDCTGLDAMATFTLAMLLISRIFRNVPMSTLKKYYVAGIVGTFAVNIIRVLLIAVSGYQTGPDGLIKSVHTNAGWITFSIWMLVFWYVFFLRNKEYLK
jgi:exosortase